MANENQHSNQPAKPAPKPIPPITPDPSTMGVCQKSNDKTKTQETATKTPPKK